MRRARVPEAAPAVLIAGQIAVHTRIADGGRGATQAFSRLMHTNLGYDPHNTMDVGIPVYIGSHPNWEAHGAYFDRLRSRIAELPEVISVANSFDATPPFNGTNQRFEIMGASTQRYNDSRLNLVGPEYFSTLRVPLRQGRVWNHAETRRGGTPGRDQ